MAQEKKEDRYILSEFSSEIIRAMQDLQKIEVNYLNALEKTFSGKKLEEEKFMFEKDYEELKVFFESRFIGNMLGNFANPAINPANKQEGFII